ncbi:MAG: pentapeptide repeat-containing protein [Alphaproteobacteria bacterium]|nr:pentapeptide repeat-containing protein [Alphaproteobacteria bacterium]
MNREETLALWRHGKDAWNAWADEMLAERERLEEAGERSAVRDSFGILKPENPPTTAWLNKSRAIFSDHNDTFECMEHVDFSGWIFPGDVRFRNAAFSGAAWFMGATFKGDAWFMGASFEGDAWFNSAKFSGDAKFGGAAFSEDADFGRATFSGDAGFGRARFSGTAWFAEATFEENAWFNTATFKGKAGFGGAKFKGNALFDSATFKGYTTFVKAGFLGLTDFSAIHSERAFSLADATFKRVPDFIQANFTEAPRLDESHFGSGFVEGETFSARFKSRIKRLFGGDPDVPARWRALKRLAIQGHDHEREQIFFPMEIRSARFVTDWPLPLRFWKRTSFAGFIRFWFGILYGITSVYGRSVLWPTIWLIVSTGIFAALYLGESQTRAGTTPASFLERSVATFSAMGSGTVSLATGARQRYSDYPCSIPAENGTHALEPATANTTDALTEAVQLAIANGSVLGALQGPSASRRTYGCLFGFSEGPKKRLLYPIVPATVSSWLLLQKTIAIILIFLLGLGIRNMLKVH